MEVREVAAVKAPPAGKRSHRRAENMSLPPRLNPCMSACAGACQSRTTRFRGANPAASISSPPL